MPQRGKMDKDDVLAQKRSFVSHQLRILLDIASSAAVFNLRKRPPCFEVPAS